METLKIIFLVAYFLLVISFIATSILSICGIIETNKK